jgi:hypothetical protein
MFGYLFLSKSATESPYRITRLASTLVFPYLNILLIDFIENLQQQGDLV